MQLNSVQYSTTVQYSLIQYITVKKYNTALFSKLRYNSAL